ncbi:hypothetical protein KP509_24G012700 [Ceratopteris richardii]|uniref:Uncharacterized protein n=1 Tax=Ceratopteris richardii TaxID=49495 RepID=A0A8T2RUN0_CERRI|nr:hypothetical protein KP509_24G012700 [Ceratopteris richardii]
MKHNRSGKMDMLQKLISFVLIASTLLSVVSSARQLSSQDHPQKPDSIACGGLPEPSIHATSTFGFIAMTAGDVEQFHSASVTDADIRTSSLQNILGQSTPPPGGPIINSVGN